MKDPRYSKGFTLVELIMSVAALSLVCALVLKLFLLCFELNQKAEIKQQAVSSGSEVAEMILRIDDIIASSGKRPAMPPGGPGGMGGMGGMDM